MAEYQAWMEETIEKIEKKMAWVSEKSRNKIPYTTINGVHDDKSDGGNYRIDDGINWWCNGFWGGMMWLMYQKTGEEKYRDIARISEEKLDQCFLDYNGLHHDVSEGKLLAVCDGNFCTVRGAEGGDPFPDSLQESIGQR